MFLQKSLVLWKRLIKVAIQALKVNAFVSFLRVYQLLHWLLRRVQVVPTCRCAKMFSQAQFAVTTTLQSVVFRETIFYILS
jgi:hypothetical protein